MAVVHRTAAINPFKVRHAMKIIASILLMMIVTFASAQTTPAERGANLSPAAQSMAEATKAIGEKPAQYAGYNLLASALIRRAQETGDVSFYYQAESIIG